MYSSVDDEITEVQLMAMPLKLLMFLAYVTSREVTDQHRRRGLGHPAWPTREVLITTILSTLVT